MTAPYTRLTAALADRYRLERELGQGGMATVYLAEDLKHHRKVAIKVLKPDLATAVGAAADEVAWLVQYGAQVPYTWQLHALVAALQGDRAKALEILAPVNTAPLDFHLTFHLAESFAMAGDTARALAVLEEGGGQGFLLLSFHDRVLSLHGAAPREPRVRPDQGKGPRPLGGIRPRGPPMTDSGLRVVVVGAGINGLVAAHYLRRAGCSVTLIERADRVGGACVSDLATVNGRSQRYALGASVLGLMPDFIFRETGLADRLETFVPRHPKRVYFPDPKASAWIYRDPVELEQELKTKWGERGDVAGFRRDEARVVAYLQEGFRTATPPNLNTARHQLGDALTGLWISGSAADLLDYYFTAERTKIYMAMTVTESGPVSLREPYSAFTLPVMDSGSVFDGYYGFVKDGLWRVTEELAQIDREIGVDIRLACQVERVDPDMGEVRYSQAGRAETLTFDYLAMATDPLTAARLVGDQAMTANVEGKRFLGTSGKLSLMFRNPVRWKEGTADADGDTAFRFVFAVESLAAFERATLRVVSGEVNYEPGYIQIYCEGAAMRQLGLAEPFDRLTLFFKNVALNQRGEALPEVEAAVKAQVFAHIANPEDCVWSRMLTPRDLQQLFLFPGGNLDHTMLVGGQTFFERQFAADPDRYFYQFGRWANLAYCGAGAYPCGSIAGTPGYMCAQQLVRQMALCPA